MSTITANGRGVLVTGCSSGIGRATAIYLAHSGFTVFAGVRKEADAEALGRLGEPGLVPICPLDLSQPGHIPPVVERIAGELERRRQPGLYAIVNNAGAGVTAPIELLDSADLRTELETRLVGPVALLQACLPLIRQARGRIIWITTPGLMPIPFVASIHAPDFSVNCLVRTLNIELKPWGIPAIMVRCGTIQTAAPGKAARELQAAMARWPAGRLDLYRRALVGAQAQLGQLDARRTPPEEVARVVGVALTAGKPRLRYRVGRLAGLSAVMELLPQPAIDYIMLCRG